MTTFAAVANVNSGTLCRMSPSERRWYVNDLERVLRCKVRFSESLEESAKLLSNEFLDADVTVVIGGDGTLGAAFETLAPLAEKYPEKAIAGIPGGSGCAFSYEFYGAPSPSLLGLAFHLDRIKDKEMHRHELDLICVNEDRLAFFTSLGVSANVIATYEQSYFRGRSAKIGYGVAVLLEGIPFVKTGSMRCSLTHEQNEEAYASLILLSKFKHVGLGAKVMPGAVHDDGKIHGRVFDKRALLEYVPRSYFGAQTTGRYFAADKIAIGTTVPVLYEINGDVQKQARSKFTFDVVRNAVRVLY